MDLIRIKEGTPELSLTASKQIAKFEQAIKELKEKEEELKQAILNEMENKNILKVETDYLVINYIAPFDREDLDKKRFREDHQDIYDEYVKMTPVKSSIRIKLK